MFSLKGKVALVTGGNGGLGQAMALGMVEAGAQVIVTGRNAAKNKQAGQKLGESGGVICLDVRDESSIAKAIDDVVKKFGRFDILVNNAGGVHSESIVELSQDDWNLVIGTHLTGSFLFTKYGAKAMISQGSGGKIINIGSMYSLFGPFGIVSYASAKAGILGLTRGSAVELARHKIQVNAIVPGWFWTDLNEVLRDTPIEEQIRLKTPAGRWGNVDDVVGTAVYLASSASDFVTGTAIPVDGGYSVSDGLKLLVEE